MLKMKKSWTISLAVILSLGACWFVGQQINPDGGLKETPEQESSQPVEQEMSQSPLGETAINLDSIIYEGSIATDGNPWKTTAGTIDLEDRGKSIFLTPNTTALLSNVSEMNEIAFSYEIHPWVKESSDGAGLVIWLMDAQNNIIHEEEIVISASDDMKEFRIDLTQYEGVTKIKFLCNNGTNENDSGDWVVLSGF